jgi:hypothetical protein
MRLVILFLLALLPWSLAAAEGILFPQPLHLTRSHDDPVSGTKSVVEEYFIGNQSISIRGAMTAIVDHARGEMIVIDRERGEYSVTPFHALKNPSSEKAASRTNDWKVETVGADTRAARAVTRISVHSPSQKVKCEAAFDQEILLSRAAAEVILGIAYPNEAGDDVRALLEASSVRDAQRSESTGFRLPLEMRFTTNVGGDDVQYGSTITAVAFDAPPATQTSIPPGARRVERSSTSLSLELEQLDGIRR